MRFYTPHYAQETLADPTRYPLGLMGYRSFSMNRNASNTAFSIDMNNINRAGQAIGIVYLEHSPSNRSRGMGGLMYFNSRRVTRDGPRTPSARGYERPLRLE